MKKIIVSIIIFALVAGVLVIFLWPKSQQAASAPKVTIPLPPLPAPGTVFKHDPNIEVAFVPRVIDGDTIQVEILNSSGNGWKDKKTVRYIGMDTPETVSPTKSVECYGHEASDHDKELVQGKWVALQKDVSETDKYGRLLRFVYLLNTASSTLGTFINLDLVKDGYARVLSIPPDTEYKDEFLAASQSAESARLGFWGACPDYPFK